MLVPKRYTRLQQNSAAIAALRPLLRTTAINCRTRLALTAEFYRKQVFN